MMYLQGASRFVNAQTKLRGGAVEQTKAVRGAAAAKHLADVARVLGRAGHVAVDGELDRVDARDLGSGPVDGLVHVEVGDVDVLVGGWVRRGGIGVGGRGAGQGGALDAGGAGQAGEEDDG